MKEVFIERRNCFLRIALREDGAVTEYYTEENKGKAAPGELYKGIVKNIIPSMKGVFLDIGVGKNAYMVLEPGIKKGQELLVEVLKEEHGDKGAKVSSSISLPGRLMVLHTYDNKLSFSKKLSNKSFKALVESSIDIPEGIGVTIRTKAEEYPIEDILEELEELYEVYLKLMKAFNYTKGPGKLLDGNSILYRVLRNVTLDNTSVIYINNQEDFKAAYEALDERTKDKLILYSGFRPLFDYYGIEKELLSLRNKTIELRSGGNIIIESTEAMQVIDVNTAKSLRGKSSSENILITNLEAAEEAAKQIRIRNLSGIIIIDFVDMISSQDREKVLNKLNEGFQGDMNKTIIYPFTDLGLVQISRRRRTEPNSVFMEAPCLCCKGNGRRLSTEYLTMLLENEALKLLDGVVGIKGILFDINIFYKEQLALDRKIFIKGLQKLELPIYISYSEREEDFASKQLIYNEQLEENIPYFLRLEE